jgi:hypothetical protein
MFASRKEKLGEGLIGKTDAHEHPLAHAAENVQT